LVVLQQMKGSISMKSYRKAIWAILIVTAVLYCVCLAYYGLVLGQWPDGGVDLMLLWVPAVACFFSLAGLLAVHESRRPNVNRLAALAMAAMCLATAAGLVVGLAIERTVYNVQRIAREHRDTRRRHVVDGILGKALPLVGFGSEVEPSTTIPLPLLVMEWDEDSKSFREGSLWGMPTGFDPWFSDNPEMTYKKCTVVFVKETGRKHVSDYHATTREAYERRLSAAMEQMREAEEARRLEQLTGGRYRRVQDPALPQEESGPTGPPSGRGERVELSACLISWPEKEVVGIKRFIGLPPATTYFDPKTPASERVADGTREAEEAISRWIEQAVKKNQ